MPRTTSLRPEDRRPLPLRRFNVPLSHPLAHTLREVPEGTDTVWGR